jgi:hypothetical protein
MREIDFTVSSSIMPPFEFEANNEIDQHTKVSPQCRNVNGPFNRHPGNPRYRRPNG